MLNCVCLFAMALFVRLNFLVSIKSLTIAVTGRTRLPRDLRVATKLIQVDWRKSAEYQKYEPEQLEAQNEKAHETLGTVAEESIEDSSLGRSFFRGEAMMSCSR
jgi:hypothetical protein